MGIAKIYRLYGSDINSCASRIVTPSPQKPRLLDQVRQALRARHYSHRTEKSYVHWIKRFILFHHKRHPLEMGESK
jgi:hypothetical protein